MKAAALRSTTQSEGRAPKIALPSNRQLRRSQLSRVSRLVWATFVAQNRPLPLQTGDSARGLPCQKHPSISTPPERELSGVTLDYAGNAW